MNNGVEALHLDSLFEDMSGRPEAAAAQDVGGNTIELCESAGEGFFRRMPIRPGMQWSAIDLRLKESRSFQVEMRYPHLELSFALSGATNWSVRGSRAEWELRGGECGLNFLHDASVRFEIPKTERLVGLELRMDFRLWRNLFAEFRWLTKGSFYCQKQPISAEVRLILEQIQRCSFTGQVRQYYLEGKALELIALHLYGMDAKAELEAGARRLNAQDVEKLYRVKEWLGRNRADPPGLIELARQAGLNDYKLKAGFKELFGTTVYGYVRDERMKEAKRLLELGSVNVSEAAQMVGYTNMSHFSALFRKTYGINPSTFARENGMS